MLVYDKQFVIQYARYERTNKQRAEFE